MSNKSSFLAAASRCIISPPEGIYLIGYGDRAKGNTGVHDDLYATALVMDDGSARTAIIALDMLTINEFIVDRIQSRLLPVEVVLCCSHTHAGPIAYADERSPQKNQAYIDSLVEGVVSAVRDAEASLSPARLEFSKDRAAVGINRREKMPDGHMEIGRNPDGPRDASVQVVSVFAEPSHRADVPKENRLATIVNYACHGTVLGPDNLLVSADWIGAMREKVETEIGGLTLFLQGATGDINPDMYWEDARAFEMVAEQGAAVADAVIKAVESGSKKLPAAPLKVQREVAWLPTEAPATTSRPPKNYGKPLMAMARLPGFLAVFTDLLLDRRYPWKPVIEARDGFWSVPMRINAFRIGDLALVTYAAETFTEIGIKIKSASPAAHTLFAGVSDGCISYLHTAESHEQGGYEVDAAPFAYRYPGRLQSGCEEIALDTTEKMLNRLWD